jgi:sialate O-acetylesterase
MDKITQGLRVLAILVVALFFHSQGLKAEVKLPHIFSDNMVLQRNQQVKIWGWADPGESLIVTFNGQQLESTANTSGEWIVLLDPMGHGGPFELAVKGKNTIISRKNILIGDVWICSGQSNMEMPVGGWDENSRIKDADKVIREADYPQIRFLNVEKGASFIPKDDLLNSNWLIMSPKTISSFSATAYFFGRKVHLEVGVPVGLISTNWGGTNIQAWTPWEIMNLQSEFRDINPEKIEELSEQWKSNNSAFVNDMANERGIEEKWFLPGTQNDNWKSIVQPARYEQSEIGNIDGIVWFKKKFILKGDEDLQQVHLELGAIDDFDRTYINGKLVGEMGGWNTPRSYEIDPSLLKPGKNTLVVRITDTGGSGGFTGQEKDLRITLGSNQINLSGDWLYRRSVTSDMYDIKDTGPNSFPSQLYNAMIHPLINYAIKGVIWYQGESNTHQANQYGRMFTQMITSWRKKWGFDFPFLWAQLANYMPMQKQPGESDWAELREAQHRALSLPNTGEAVLIDIGETNNIHPKNKQDVGFRLALAALKTAYEMDVISSGPTYKSLTIIAEKAYIEFDYVGSGLMAKDRYGYLKGFAITGADGKYQWAKAVIIGNTVVVYSEKVKDPKAVRYGWSDNPEDANLYNAEGLPASPFRTDSR